MIIKLNKMKEYPTAKYKMTLHSKWDVLIALHNTMESFLKQPTLEWVESHQDDYEEEYKLPFGAKLNVRADPLATKGLNSLYCKPRVPMDSSSCVQVHLNGTTITRDICREVRLRVHKQDIAYYYQERF